MGPRSNVPTEALASVAVEDGSLPARDGCPLAVTFYRPHAVAAEGGRVAVVGSSLGGDRRRYADFARFLAARGWTVLTFDCRGIGGSVNGCPPRELDIDLLGWAEQDIAGIFDWVREHLAPERLAGIGHSMGGQLFGLAPNNRELDALLLITAQTNHWRLRPTPWDLVVLGYIGVASVLVGSLGQLPLWPTGPERLPPRVARQWRRWAFDPSYPNEEGQPHIDRFAAFPAPLLSVSFSDDPFYAPPEAVEALLRLFSRASKQRWYFRPADLGLSRVGHRGFFRPELCSRLWEPVARWLEKPGIPAGHGLTLPLSPVLDTSNPVR